MQQTEENRINMYAIKTDEWSSLKEKEISLIKLFIK